MKNLLTLTLLILMGGVVLLSSCDEDSPATPDGPKITAPGVTSLQTGTSVDVTFSITVAGGYKSSALGTVVGGTASITSEPTAGATSGDIVVNFTAGNDSGAGAIPLTIIDNNDKTTANNAVLNITSTPPPPPNEVVSGFIEADKTFTNDRIWELAGRVIVTNGATLTIEPGTIVKGRPGEGTNASVLMIAKDGMIDAVGTSTQPIIFTSTDDNIEVGQLAGTNLTENDNQTWGGVVILGNAPISPSAGTTAQIEGVPAGETLGQYGGDNPTHNSGKLKYVSIRHGGTTIDPVAGNDINGLTLGGVGSGTEISHIEIFANFDDGIEYFGGTVNTSNVLIYTVGDDALDVDQAYAGTVDNFMVFTSTAASSDEGLEIDGPEGSENATGKFTIKNGNITSVDGGGSGGDFKSKSQGTINNVIFAGFTGGATIKIRASFNEVLACADKTDSYSNLIDDELVFTSVNFGAVSVYDGDDSDACNVPAGHQTAAEGKMSTDTGATGASAASEFDGWTISDIKGLL